MKKLIIILLLFLVVLGLFLFFGGNNLNKINSSEIQEIEITNPVSSVTITNQEDIQKLLEILQKPELKRDYFHSYPDGFAFLIDIRLASGESSHITIRSDSVTVDRYFYKSPASLCDEVDSFFESINNKYPVKSFDNGKTVICSKAHVFFCIIYLVVIGFVNKRDNHSVRFSFRF